MEEKKGEEKRAFGSGLNSKIDGMIDKKLEDYILKKERLKDSKRVFKIPYSIRSRALNAYKKSKIWVIMLKSDHTVEPLIAERRDGLIKVNNKYYDGATAFVFLWRGKVPVVVIPEWSLRPVGYAEYERDVKNGSISDPQEVIIRALESEEFEPKKKIDIKWWLIIGLVAIVIGYILFGKG